MIIFEQDIPSADEVVPLVETIGKMLQRKHPAVIGAVLADLTAMWLAQHCGREQLREDLLQQQMAIVRGLIPMHEAVLIGTMAP